MLICISADARFGYIFVVQASQQWLTLGKSVVGIQHPVMGKLIVWNTIPFPLFIQNDKINIFGRGLHFSLMQDLGEGQLFGIRN